MSYMYFIRPFLTKIGLHNLQRYIKPHININLDIFHFQKPLHSQGPSRQAENQKSIGREAWQLNDESLAQRWNRTMRAATVTRDTWPVILWPRHPKSRKISFPNLFIMLRIFINFCTEYGNVIAVLSAKFQKDLSNDIMWIWWLIWVLYGRRRFCEIGA